MRCGLGEGTTRRQPPPGIVLDGPALLRGERWAVASSIWEPIGFEGSAKAGSH